ncbi:MAG: hypothetical protein KC482_05445 [Dehalococcoidia bacterium]|nr:hypothetical protein [Dehalococcoidia bacterium]MCA9843632.1 hypothetical protein [Dehalococcoidia bacterium]MCA9853031.1 hypothetical protein [Dehalococcoidia bacterium]
MYDERYTTFALTAGELHALWRGDPAAAREARWTEFLRRHRWPATEAARATGA